MSKVFRKNQLNVTFYCESILFQSIMTLKSSTNSTVNNLSESRMNLQNAQGDSGESGDKKKHGLSIFASVLFIAGENAGAALLALPYAFNQAGWYALPLMIMIGVDSLISGALIGKCWLILEERWPEFREHCRLPYVAIGRMAYGSWMSSLVTFSLQVTCIGSSVVVLLICAQLVSNLLDPYTGFSYGTWIIVIACCLFPFMWLGSPGDFWFAAALALLTTSIAVVLLLIDVVTEFYQNHGQPAIVTEPTFSTGSLAFGTFLFAFGGTAAFPTIQNDMKRKNKFTLAVIYGFIILLCLYIPFGTLGYLTYGASVKNNVIMNIETGTKRDIALFLLSFHLFFAFLIVINPPVQQIENKLGISANFSWKRIVVRFFVLIFVVFVGESIPHFGKILDFLGGSTITGLAYVFPPLFYIKLCSMKNDAWPERKISPLEKLYYYKIIVIGIFGGISCTFWALEAILSPDAFTLPCYIDVNCSNE